MIKESLLNVLMYVFENFIEDEIDIKSPKNIISEMVADGFQKEQATQALDWFASLSSQQQADETFCQKISDNSFRIYLDYELHKITNNARQLLRTLEKADIIDSYLREIIIHHAMALDEPIIDEAEIKWVALMALYGIPGKKTQLALLEEMVLFDESDKKH